MISVVQGSGHSTHSKILWCSIVRADIRNREFHFIVEGEVSMQPPIISQQGRRLLQRERKGELRGSCPGHWQLDLIRDKTNHYTISELLVRRSLHRSPVQLVNSFETPDAQGSFRNLSPLSLYLFLKWRLDCQDCLTPDTSCSND